MSQPVKREEEGTDKHPIQGPEPPTTSCVCMKSDCSMKLPDFFNAAGSSDTKLKKYEKSLSVERKERTDKHHIQGPESPTPSCVSLKSDLSNDEPQSLKSFSCINLPHQLSDGPQSLKNESSINLPPHFSDEAGPPDTKIQSMVAMEMETHAERLPTEDDFSSDGSEYFSLEEDTPMDIDPTSQNTSPTIENCSAGLTVALLGDSSCVEITSKNLLLAHYAQEAAVSKSPQFADRLYDLCGRHVSVINMLGLQNTEGLAEGSLQGQGVHAFVLLLPFGQHVSSYTTGMKWLEKQFGKMSQDCTVIVVTHDKDENSDSALTDLRAISDFNEKRYHSCTKSMTKETEMISLLEKIDGMICEHEPHSCNVENTEEKQHRMDVKFQEEERSSPRGDEDNGKNKYESALKAVDVNTTPGNTSSDTSSTVPAQISETGSTDGDSSITKDKSDLKAVHAGKSGMTGVGEDDNTTLENKSSDTSSRPTVPAPSETGSIDGDSSKNKYESDFKAVDAGSSDITDSVGEDDNTTPENKSSDNSSTVPAPSETGSIGEDSTEDKDKSQPKAVDAGSSEIREDDNTSENKSSDTSSTVPVPGSIDGDSSKNKDKSDLKAVDAGSSDITDSVGEDDNTTPENKSSDPSSTVPAPSETGSIGEDSTEDKDKSQPKAVDAGSSEIREDDNTSGNKSSDTSSTVPVPGSIDEDSSTNKDKIHKTQPKAVDAGSSEIREDDNTSGNKSSDTSSTVPAPGETGSIDEDINKSKDEVVKGEQYVKNSQEISPEKLLSRLNLKDNYQVKLSTADFLKIGPSIKKPHEITERDLAHAFLQKLLMLDHRARYIPVTVDNKEEDHLKETPDSDMAATKESLFDILCMANVNSDQSVKQCHVHPMDVQMAVFHCSDSFLRQNVITKLSQCQYALPLLVPDPFTRDIQCPLWTFRQVKKTWKVTDNSGAITCMNMPICQAKTHMVSFLRLGSVSSSKSQLMNTLINDRHSTFFHRNCPGATKSHCLIDGMAEIAWYFPAGKPNDAFSDCVAFCNLHGDALSLEKQREILIDKASVNVVLLPTLGSCDKSIETMVSDLVKDSKPLICLLADNDSVAKQIQPGKYTMGVKDRSQSDVAEELKGIIRNILSTSEASFQLESMGNASGIKTDEEDPECRTGKSAALKIVDLLERTELSKIKDTFLPRHGHLWYEWCRVNKELYRLSGNIEKDKCEKEKKMTQIRQEQCDKPSSELMQMFIKNLQSPKLNERLYFLKWIGFFLDNVFTDKLSEINQAYDAKWSEVLALKKKKEQGTSQLLKDKQKELGDISDKLQSATVGVEHILREIGQIYEAHASISNMENLAGQPTELMDGNAGHVPLMPNYPKLAAELMIAGQPMELMDGDAAHVPLTWITSVLDEVIKTLGDKRVFVLSVLGIQSSGKSTMLNAMFGLQFAVSAGRCTRGAFMQLVEVSEEIQEVYKFDYVLVVDTEGLRAPELAGQDTRHHDNELATFVIGLGNMTLINIFGENPSEMQDVLHIAVQAFMRMKKVNLSPSCLFVHQNVAAIEAGDKNKVGKRRLQGQLDEMTKLAAKEEGDIAELFSDVIAFDVETDVKYISQLWEGNPPMAPPNPGYSESIQELKNTILSKASKSKGMTLSEFNSTIKDLWNALLNENFVFSFKNTQEIALYRELEEEYGKWTWELRQSMLTTENQLFNRIENERLEIIEQNGLVEGINKTRKEVDKKMKRHFDDNKVKDTLFQWKGRFEINIENFHNDLVKGAKHKLEKIIQQRNARKMLDDKKTEDENKLIKKSQELAATLKKGMAMDEKALAEEFNIFWKKLVTDLTADSPPIKEINIQDDVDSVLKETFSDTPWTVIEKCKQDYKNISSTAKYYDYVKMNSKWKELVNFLANRTLPHEFVQQIKTFIDDVEIQSLAKMKVKPVNTTGYDISYLLEVANLVKTKVKHFANGKKYALKTEFAVELLLHVFANAAHWLLESHKEFKKNNDALAYLENKKEQYSNVFKSSCKGSSSAAVLSELLCSEVKMSAVQAVHDKTAIDLAGEMKGGHPPFSGNRANLEKHVLKSLAEKEDFSMYVKYIEHPKKQVEEFIKETVDEYISTNKNKVHSIMKVNVDEIIRRLNKALDEATTRFKFQSQLKNTDTWLKKFSRQLKDYLIFATNCYGNFNDIDDFDFLKEQIKKGFDSMKADLDSLSFNMVDARVKPDQIFIDQLCKCCWVQCPFCSAICTNTLEDHSPDDHSVTFHRPCAVNGMHFRGTLELCTTFCTSDVASDRMFYPKPSSEESIPYKEYRKGGPAFANWRITPDESRLTYWKWFVCQFKKQLEDHHGKQFKGYGEIPKEWKKYTKEEAIESLENM